MRPFKIIPIVLAVALIAVANWSAPTVLAGGYIVDTTADDPTALLTACTGAADDCSLRGAVANANAGGPGDVIVFDSTDFPVEGTPGTIMLGNAGPSLTGGGDTIDGTGAGVLLQGAEARTFVCLSLNSAGNTVEGIQFTDCSSGIQGAAASSDNNTIGPGNTFSDSNFAIFLASTASGNVIAGNYIGTTPDGTAASPDPLNSGVGIDGTSNRVGGTAVQDRNYIVGTTGTGGITLGSTASGNMIEGNYIGVPVGGTTDLGNANGISVDGSNNTIGGATAAAGNVISGNSTNVSLANAAATGNTIANNLIGPDATGGGAVVSVNGVFIASGASNNIIGPGNTLSDNSAGVWIKDASTQGNVVKGNRIGTGLDPATPLANLSTGVYVSGGAHDHDIGGTTAGDGNVIAFNVNRGVWIEGSGSTGNSIRGNSIHDNGTAEIDNASGGNTELTPPTIAGAASGAAGGTACANCTIEVFSDGASDAEFLEGTTVADGGGNWVLLTSIAGPFVTATATDAQGNTSELSAAAGFGTDTDADGVADSIDNCPDDPNPLQENMDGDGDGDVCDSDVDGDGVANISDIWCPAMPEDFDGYQDGDGCPDTDNDLDGICDAGLTSVSCTGSDVGRYVWQNPLGGTVDCRNVAEDFDAFHDTDGCPEPDNDYDTFPDGTDDCPATDTNVGPDGIADTGDEPVLYLTPYQAREDFDGVIDWDGCHDSPNDDYDGDGLGDETEVFTLGTDPVNPDTDADTVIDGTDNCPSWPNTPQNLPPWPVPAGDADCDGFTKAREEFVGTDPAKHCNNTTATNDEPDYWPTDFNDSRFTNNSDLILIGPSYNKISPDPAYNKRFDLNANGSVTNSDVILFGPFYNKGCG